MLIGSSRSSVAVTPPAGRADAFRPPPAGPATGRDAGMRPRGLLRVAGVVQHDPPQLRQRGIVQMIRRATGQLRNQFHQHGHIVAAAEARDKKQPLHLGALQGIGEFAWPVGRIDVDQHHPDTRSGQLQQQPLDVVGRPDADAIALARNRSPAGPAPAGPPRRQFRRRSGGAAGAARPPPRAAETLRDNGQNAREWWPPAAASRVPRRGGNRSARHEQIAHPERIRERAAILGLAAVPIGTVDPAWSLASRLPAPSLLVSSASARTGGGSGPGFFR